MKKYNLRRLRKKITVFSLRFTRAHRIEKYAISLICCLIALVVFKMDLLNRFELTLLDYRFRINRPQPLSDNIVLVDIAQDSIEQIGRWPWDRGWHAGLITALKAFGAKAVLYDVIFSEPSTKEQDAVLKKAVANAGNVYLPYLFNTEQINSKNLITSDSIYSVDSYMQTLKEAVKGDGFINILPDADGTLRRVPLIIEYLGKSHFQIAFGLACDLLGVNKKEIIVKKASYIRLPVKNKPPYQAAQGAISTSNPKSDHIDIPIDENYQMLINWPGGWKTSFRHFSFIDIIKSFQMLTGGEKPLLPTESFNGKICVVGMAASGLMDIKPIPAEPLYPAVGVNACILDNILRADFCRKLPDGFIIAFIIILTLVTARFISIYHPLRDFLLTGLLLFSYAAGAILLFLCFQLWINIIYPALAILLTYTGLTLYNEVRIIIEKKSLSVLATTDRLTNLYQKEHFNALMKISFAERREKKDSGQLSLIMADIDHFKQINDTYGHLFGDVALKKVAQTIKSICRPLDICARYGGEEFIIMLPNTTLKEAFSIAERIRKAVEKKIIRYGKRNAKITVSLGVASLTKEKNEELLIQRADHALYAAKAGGRNMVCQG